MKIYEVRGMEKYFKTLSGAKKYVLSLGIIEKVKVSDYKKESKKGYFVNSTVYCKKRHIYANDYTHYEFYDCLKSGMSYTDFLLKNKCLEPDTDIYFEENSRPRRITIVEIEVIE